MFKWSLLTLLCASYSVAAADEIRLNFVRPSRILAALTGKTTNETVYNATGAKEGLIPEGVKIKADDKKSVLIVTGPKDDVAALASYVSLFDVAPKTMTAQVTIDAPVDKFNSKTSTTLRNNDTYTFGQEYIGLKLTISARLNDDNTVSLFISTGQKSGAKRLVVRTKFQKVVQIVTDDLLAGNSEMTQTETAAGIIVGKKGEASTTVSIFMLPPVDDDGPKEIPPQAQKNG